MKFSVSQEKLVEGLQTVQSVVGTRSTLPILSNLLIEAENGELRLTTTDLDVGIRCPVEAQIEKPGATTLPARTLFSIIRELAAGEVRFEIDTKNIAAITSGASRFKVFGPARGISANADV